jgi:predicted nucleic acid-binding protein
MIGIDTSSWVAFLSGEAGADVTLLERALKDHQAVMLPAVLSELSSDCDLSQNVLEKLLQIPLLDVDLGYWRRAGETRAKVLARQRKARLADALIAQSCIDRQIPLITRDGDFGVFAQVAGLELLV